jgi:ribonuclease P protein component
MATSFAFPKRERLTSKKEIDALFQSGEAFFIYPYKLIYRLEAKMPDFEALQALITVPKRFFKLANRRNYLKRIGKESYRLQKHELHSSLIEKNLRLQFILIYQIKETLSYAEIDKSMSQVIKHLRHVVASKAV